MRLMPSSKLFWRQEVYVKALQPRPCAACGSEEKLSVQVSRTEFMIFMLQQLDLVHKEELDNILEMFDSADINGDGVLDVADVRRRMRRSPPPQPGCLYTRSRAVSI
jgi:hypothetical protein